MESSSSSRIYPLPPRPPRDPRRALKVVSQPTPLYNALVPMHGAYVTFTLDPVATLEALDDPIATEQAQRLRPKKYVGCLAANIDVISSLRRYHKCTIIFLSQGLPKASEADGFSEVMCVPILPAQHPTGRRGITVFPPLPWDDLYHHTMLALDLRL
ncbi:hypothetical protein BV25DRAFT_1799997, partial [Artomyces pyxidatus]